MYRQDAHRNLEGSKSQCTSSDDWRRIFTENAISLYLLAYLLAGNQEVAERCVVLGLADCVAGNPVFKEWADSWARRIIVNTTISTIAPHVGLTKQSWQQTGPIGTAEATSPNTPFQADQFASILALEDFERFVYVLSVREGYSDQDCADLLNARGEDILERRIRALEHIAEFERRTGVSTV